MEHLRHIQFGQAQAVPARARVAEVRSLLRDLDGVHSLLHVVVKYESPQVETHRCK